MTHIIHSLEAIKNLLDDICMRIRNEEAETVRVENVVVPRTKRLRSIKLLSAEERDQLAKPRNPLRGLTIWIVNMMDDPTREALDRIWCDQDEWSKVFQPDEFRDAFVSAGLCETYNMILNHQMNYHTRSRILRLAIRGLRPDLIQRLCDEASTCVDDSEYEA
jgi:hypothetical protein